MLALAAPVFAEESLTLLVSYTDWWLTCRFLPGPEHQAAMSLMGYALWLIPVLFAAVAIGATALVARAVGAGDRQRAQQVTHQALLCGFALSAALTAILLLSVRSLVAATQLQGVAGDLAVRYCLIIAPVVPAIMVEQVAAACLRGAGDTYSGFVAKSIVNVINVAVSAALVVGWGPFPKLGWDGIAMGTACGHVCGAALLLALLLRGRAGLQLRRGLWRPRADLIRQLKRVGLPGGVDMLTNVGCHFVYLAIINRLGTEAAAAHGLGVQVEALGYLPAAAFGVAAATLAGQRLGAGDPQGARRAARAACWAGMVFLTSVGMVFYFGGRHLCAFFTGDYHDPTGREAAELLKIVALSEPSLAITMVLSGAFRGAGDTRWPLYITLVGMLGVRLPLAMFLAWDQIPVPGLGFAIAGCGWHVRGAWWAMLIDVVFRGFLFAARCAHGGWLMTRVFDPRPEVHA